MVKPALFFLVVIAGLWYVKWQPYCSKAFTAAETHSIGKSILAQADANPWQAALNYAMILFSRGMESGGAGVILGSLIQVLIRVTGCCVRLGNRAFAARCWERCFAAGYDVYLLCGSGRGGNASPTGVDGRCAGILDGESVVKPGDAGVYGVRPRLGFCGDSSVAGW